ncbi:sporulation protein YpjB [Domibacillus sp. PGB-M46]|uniref:sporulation protein YpjB n=1 Tax=Domibacillus sp. PGB-M46 TaxID=2910255 RepID=UPI001F5738DD|nr:sporulation protein YpjB [Domibacillus sp. PGB-M46]MCI2254694.1 sporulation protein YpjB [Domibacillus sp. PGB-M46]
MDKIIAFIWSFLLIFVPVSGAEEMNPEKKEDLIHVTALTGGVVMAALIYTGRKKYKGTKEERKNKHNL